VLIVTGANGQLAQAVIGELRQLVGGDERVVVTTRDPGSPTARRLAGEGVEVRHADFDDPASLVSGFAGATKVLVISTMAPNDQRLQMHLRAIDAAEAAGARHVVYTSFINAGADSITEHSRLVHYPTEQRLRSSGLDYTILRHSLYAETLVDDLERTLATGVFSRPGGAAAAAYIARDDLGRSAARVLAEDGHAGRVYSETMTATLTGAEVAAQLSEATGRSIRYEAIPWGAWPAHLARAIGLPEEMVRSAGATMRALEAGEFDLVTADYETITGRAPMTFAAFLESRLAHSPMR